MPPQHCRHHHQHHHWQLSGAAPTQAAAAAAASPRRRRCSGAAAAQVPSLAASSCCCTTMASSAYDNPALYSNDDAFSERLYWDKRYTRDPTTFEWYRNYDGSLRPVLLRYLPREAAILQLGVGTSRLQEDMVAEDGYQSITSVDYSPVAIQRLLQVYRQRPELRYEVADVRAMPQYRDGAFGGVLDKGTLDALMCGDSADDDAAAMLAEVWRLLSPGGAFVMITSASPRSRLPYLQTATSPWSALFVHEVGQQGAQAGPFEAGSHEAMQLPRMGYSSIVYACIK